MINGIVQTLEDIFVFEAAGNHKSAPWIDLNKNMESGT